MKGRSIHLFSQILEKKLEQTILLKKKGFFIQKNPTLQIQFITSRKTMPYGLFTNISILQNLFNPLEIK